MQSIADLIARDLPHDPPRGHRLPPTDLGFKQLLGPVYGRLENGRLALGMRIWPRHLNPQQTYSLDGHAQSSLLADSCKSGGRPVFRSSGILKIGPISEFNGAIKNNFFDTMEEE
jgi:hypothetical protein